MNNQRRKQISGILANIGDLKAVVEILRDEEGEALENLPESLQQSERGEKSQAALAALEDAFDALESAESLLEEAQQ